MSSEACPRCGAGLQLETRGELLDKVQACSHCDFVRDVLDEVTIQQEEDGRKVTIHRKDLGGQDVAASVLGDTDLQDRVREMTGMDMNELLGNARSIQGSGKTVSRTSQTTRTLSGAEARQKLAEMGIDFDEALHASTARAPGITERRWFGWALLVVIISVLSTLGWFFGS